MSNEEKLNHQGPIPDDVSEINLDYSDLIKDRAFIGDIPFDTILEGLQKQFEDYINISDTTNYVDVFYTQLHLSYDRVNNDDSENFPNEIKDCLYDTYQRFLDTMQNLFDIRLTISIPALENEGESPDDIEFLIRRLYEFFILGARTNFRTVITLDTINNLSPMEDKEEYINQIKNHMMTQYIPLVINLTPMQFLQIRGDREIYELFDNCRVVGNFLRKYTAKLYQNEDLQNDIINYIMMVQSNQ